MAQCAHGPQVYKRKKNRKPVPQSLLPYVSDTLGSAWGGSSKDWIEKQLKGKTL